MKLIKTFIFTLLISGMTYGQYCDGLVSYLVVSTGYDPVTSNVVGDYGFDPMWRLTQAPADPPGWTSNIGGPAIIVPLTSPWTYAGTQSKYINAYPTAQALTDNWNVSTTPYIYEREFCVCVNEANAGGTAPVVFELSLNADNWAELYLEDEQGNVTTLMSQPFQYVTSNFINSPTTINTTLQLGNGTYKLKLHHRNKLVIMGANLDGIIYSSATLTDNVCRPKGMIAGFVNDDQNGSLTYETTDPATNGWNMSLLDENNNVVQTITTDHNGYYFFMDIEPGNYSVYAQGPSGWGVVDPNPTHYSFSIDTNVVHVGRFLVQNGAEETVLPEPTVDPGDGSINLSGDCNILIPNVFTPNGDGMNDEICFDNSCGAPFKATLFDRWGTQVFESKSPTDCWIGKDQKGKDLSDGVYYYVYEVEINKETKSYNGFIHILK